MRITGVVTDVTGSLEGGSRETGFAGNLSQLLQITPQASSLLADGRQAIGALPSLTPDEVRQTILSLAARFSATDRSGEIGSGPEIFAALADFETSDEYREDLLCAIEKACNRLELSMLIGSTEGMLSFLDYVWGSEFEENLVAITHSSRETARKWIAGSHPTVQNRELLLGATTILFQLHRQCGMNLVETNRYFKEVPFSPSSDPGLRSYTLCEWIAEYIPFRTPWRNGQIPLAEDLADHIAAIGGDREVFQANFRYRFLF